MIRLLTVTIAALFCYQLTAQSLVGAWSKEYREGERRVKAVVIFSDNHQVATWYDADTGDFLHANGGSWLLDGGQLIETVEFNTKEPETVGNSFTLEIALDQNTLQILDDTSVWKRLDSGDGDLAGAWLISGRMRDGQIQERSTDRPRKTMKILSGSRFQWIAYNTSTKEFFGTGGGTYTSTGGKYIETIEFFSRDVSRVGAELPFNYEIKEGKWHHSGNNSRGEPMYGFGVRGSNQTEC